MSDDTRDDDAALLAAFVTSPDYVVLSTPESIAAYFADNPNVVCKNSFATR